jgi:hypothetical protein
VKPAYDKHGARLYLGDAASILPTLKDDVDLLATDPPYGIAYQSNYRAEPSPVIAGDRGEVDVPAIIGACLPRLGRMRHVYAFGPKEALSHPRLVSHVELVWDKEITGMGDLQCPWGPSHENITFAIHAPWRSDRTRERGKLSARLRAGSVLRVPRVNSKHLCHPNQKPVALMRQIIESSSSFGETVLDPFMGSGSTIVAALLSGRQAVGIEINDLHFEHAVERIERLGPTLQQLESA